MAEEQQEEKKPAPKPPQLPVHPLHIAAGVLFLIAALAFLNHRIPKKKYVAVNVDKPRPAAAAAAAAAAPKPAPGLPAITPKTGSSAAPEAPAGEMPGARPAPLVEKAAPVDIAWACSAEAGLLCYKVAEERLRRCLLPFEDAVRKICRDALIPPSAPVEGEDPY